jgi:hypothetical protein
VADQKLVDDAQDVEIGKKVDKVEGKDLIATSEIERLATLKNYDDTALADRVTTAEGKITALETESAKHALKTELEAVDAKFADYKTAEAQKTIDDEQDRRLGVLEGASATHATKDELAGVDAKFADYTKTADLPTDLGDFTNNAGYTKTADVNAELAKKADKTQVATDIAEAIAPLATTEALNGVKATAEAAAVKTEVNAALDLKADKSVVNAMYTNEQIDAAILVETNRAKAAEEGLQTQINTIMNNPDTEGVINSINEFTQYITDHGAIAEGFRADIDVNKKAIEDQHDELVAYVDEKAVPADYNVNDENDPAYIKNRPFYEAMERTELLTNLTQEEYWNENVPYFELTPGLKYDVVWNDVSYNDVLCNEYGEIWVDTDTNRLRIWNNSDRPDNAIQIETWNGEPFTTISLSITQNVIHRIEQKYLPFYETEGIYDTWLDVTVESQLKTDEYAGEGYVAEIPVPDNYSSPNNGDEYIITINGVEYRESYKQVYSAIGVFGPRNRDELTPEHPFSIWTYNTTIFFDFLASVIAPGSVTVNMQKPLVPSKLVQIEEKFIPNSIARVSDVSAADAALKEELQGEIDSDVAAAIAAEVERADGAYDAKGAAAAAKTAAEATAASALAEAVEDLEGKITAVDTGVMAVEAGDDIVVTADENGKVTVAHETFTTGEYTKDPASSDKDGDVYLMTSVQVDNGHVTGASVKSLADALMGMTFIFDGGTSADV